MSAMSYTYTTLDVSYFSSMTLFDPDSCLQTDAELSRLIGTLRLNSKVRAFSYL